MKTHIDSFSSSIADLKPRDRTQENALRCLKSDPRVSTFDMSEHHRWLPGLIAQLEVAGKVVSAGGVYPWHEYKIVKERQK